MTLSELKVGLYFIEVSPLKALRLSLNAIAYKGM